MSRLLNHLSGNLSEQIKSSGSLRYFDQKLVSLMNDYDVQAKKTVKREDIDLRYNTRTIWCHLPSNV